MALILTFSLGEKEPIVVTVCARNSLFLRERARVRVNRATIDGSQL